MKDHPFKLGDKVIIVSSPYQGELGHVIGITRDGDEAVPAMLTVRLFKEPKLETRVTHNDIRKA